MEPTIWPSGVRKWSIWETTDSATVPFGANNIITTNAQDTVYLWAETTVGSFHVGDTVHKQGYYSGHTYGKVSATCVDINVNSLARLFCQIVAQMQSGSGDSGATVYYPNTGILTGRATLLGVLEGKITYTDSLSTPHSYFASIDYVHWAISDNGPTHKFTACYTCSSY